MSLDLSETERTFLNIGAAVALDHAAHHGAIRYLGMPARSVAGYTLGIAIGTYYAGMGLSYLINNDQGISDYRYAIDTILGSAGGFKELQQKTILNFALAATPHLEMYANVAGMHAKHIIRTVDDRLDRYTNDLLI